MGLTIIIPGATLVGIAVLIGIIRAPKAAGNIVLYIPVCSMITWYSMLCEFAKGIIDPGQGGMLAGFRSYIDRHRHARIIVFDCVCFSIYINCCLVVGLLVDLSKDMAVYSYST